MYLKYLFLFLIINLQSCNSVEKIAIKSNEETFLKEQTELGTPIWKYLRSNTYSLNSLTEVDFIQKVDSLKNLYIIHLETYKDRINEKMYEDELVSINYAFDEFILKYPVMHRRFTGENIIISEKHNLRLINNLKKINDPTLLSNEAFINYIKSYLSIESNRLLKNGTFKKYDNQQLYAYWNSIERIFANKPTKDFWKYEYLNEHIKKFGIKNIEKLYQDFMSTTIANDHQLKLKNVYESHKISRDSHIIDSYKNIDDFKLEMHIFLPDTVVFKGNRPTIVHFHGGSWSEGKPDWFFGTANDYAKKGWIVAVVEYRIKGRHGTYPFEAVKDAKSAIRWLRENSKKYRIDSDKIIATGNSAGGHLSLATVLVDNWNEKTDDLSISAVPNVVIVNSAVYDLTSNSTRWIAAYNDNKKLVNEISPNKVVKKTRTKFLLVHGEKDENCPYNNAVQFYTEMKTLQNDITLHTVKNGTHWIWYDHNASEVSRVTSEFIEKLDFE